MKPVLKFKGKTVDFILNRTHVLSMDYLGHDAIEYSLFRGEVMVGKVVIEFSNPPSKPDFLVEDSTLWLTSFNIQRSYESFGILAYEDLFQFARHWGKKNVRLRQWGYSGFYKNLGFKEVQLNVYERKV